jgi:hypothetical protein
LEEDKKLQLSEFKAEMDRMKLLRPEFCTFKDFAPLIQSETPGPSAEKLRSFWEGDIKGRIDLLIACAPRAHTRSTTSSCESTACMFIEFVEAVLTETGTCLVAGKLEDFVELVSAIRRTESKLKHDARNVQVIFPREVTSSRKLCLKSNAEMNEEFLVLHRSNSFYVSFLDGDKTAVYPGENYHKTLFQSPYTGAKASLIRSNRLDGKMLKDAHISTYYRGVSRRVSAFHYYLYSSLMFGCGCSFCLR